MKKRTDKLRTENENWAFRMSASVLPTYARTPVAMVKGKGTSLWDADGKKYLDFFAGLAVDNLGHAPQEIVKAVSAQLKKLWHVSNVFLIPEQVLLADKLTHLTGLSKAFFCNSGAEANEGAIKLARYHSQIARGDGVIEIIVANHSFHGRTLGALSATAQKKYQNGFGPLVDGFKVVPFNDVEAIKEAITPQTCAVLLEPIQGEGGVNIPDADYLSKVRRLCDQRGLLLILDEVQTGIGRTGEIFAYKHAGIIPDILTMSKALGSGFPVGALVVSKEIADNVKPGIHASTFGGNPLACSAALATLNVISKPAFLKRVKGLGDYFLKKLERLAKTEIIVDSARGSGLMLALVLKEEIGPQVVKRCLDNGLLINSVQGKVLRFVPPLIITKKEIDRAVAILTAALKDERGGA